MIITTTIINYICIFIVGMLWKDLIWIFIYLPRSIIKGIIYGLNRSFNGKLNSGYTRFDAILDLPHGIYYGIKLYVKYEWWLGCEIN